MEGLANGPRNLLWTLLFSIDLAGSIIGGGGRSHGIGVVVARRLAEGCRGSGGEGVLIASKTERRGDGLRVTFSSISKRSGREISFSAGHGWWLDTC